jgi:hypothetical protein
MTRISRITIALLLATVFVGTASPSLNAQSDQNPAASVAGRWTMTVHGSPHGPATLGLVLRQSDKKVTGTFASPHGDMSVEGEFVDGTLTLATSGGESQITFKATLKDKDTLSGFLSSSMGDMTWTAERVKNDK